MNRSDFQRLASLRLAEAQDLFDRGFYSGAYYLAGYAVESALKACICRKRRAEDFPPDRKALENIYTHDLQKLLSGAELTRDHNAQERANQNFGRNWAVVKDWSEQARYETYDELAVRDLLAAITDPIDGVMQWLQRYW